MENNGNMNIVGGFLEPRYFRNFSCIGADCPENCCFGWGRIDFTPEEVAKIKSADCPADLKELIDKTFVPTYETNVPGGVDGEPIRYNVKFGENGYCPLQNEKGLCRVQLELGVEYMSKTCMVYPRLYKKLGNTILCFCNLSCYHIIDVLFNDSQAMSLTSTTYPRHIQNLGILPDDIIKKHHELKYHEELLMFFYKMIAVSACSIETVLIMGLPVAERLSELTEKKLYGRIPDILKGFWEQADGYFEAAKEYKPNYDFKLPIMATLYQNIMKNSKAIDNIVTDGKIDRDKYIEGERRVNEAFADRPFIFKNIALNMLLERGLPFGNIEYSIYENYCYFALCVSFLKTVAAAVYMGDFDPSHYEQQLKGLLPFLCRTLLQNKETVKTFTNVLKDHGALDKELIAALIK
ncbi:MAG: flagellin lysine-N-methylase [Ruminococcus sp.]|nr:flagellin lysine-N-methylase [Ruminococcus sp.]MCM1381998.1 flagellin lysine-N-methylase [Muribaculaceae bacterium]MCM1478356.1 flagellin lysine-N-methylase [Muribaculaceae bacterium]